MEMQWHIGPLHKAGVLLSLCAMFAKYTFNISIDDTLFINTHVRVIFKNGTIVPVLCKEKCLISIQTVSLCAAKQSNEKIEAHMSQFAHPFDFLL